MLTSKYKRCLECGYILEGLPENRCPECGRPFDPSDERTYSFPIRGGLYLAASLTASCLIVAAPTRYHRRPS